METNRPVWTTLAASLTSIGSGVLIFKATARPDICWWTDPVFWIGVVGLTMGASIFLWLLVPSWLRDNNVRRARQAELLQQGRANQFDGLDEIWRELGQVSSQLKGELRWGKRGGLFPNTAWTKNQHLVTGDARVLVENAYEQAHQLDQRTIAATQTELDDQETQERQSAKRDVDAAWAAVQGLRDGLQP